MTEPTEKIAMDLDLVLFAKCIKMLGVTTAEHPHAATYNEALDLAAKYVLSFIGREEYLPRKARPDLASIVERLSWVRKFIAYARYELQPGTQQSGDQFPRQDAADNAMAELDAVIAALREAADTLERSRGKA